MSTEFDELSSARQAWFDKLTERQRKMVEYAETHLIGYNDEMNELIAALAKELDAIHEAYANDA